ncbi:hypothetical protein HHI36_006826 [Cryptolaemus montrouzieri]|uniref:PLAT domain-containing protein n=1 Tax=Cryptolaemus montrouzieri TaxID=559131 RepID=A0ABD2MN64_9CUCU
MGQKHIYRHENLKILAEFKGCNKKKYIYDYNLISLDTGTEKRFFNNPGPILYVNKYSLETGLFKVVLNVHSEEVYFDSERNPLFARIKGGFQRYVQPGANIILDASSSVDNANEDSMDIKNFEYSWVYDCNECGGFITSNEKGPVLKIKTEEHSLDDKYLVKLGIKSRWWSKMVYAFQIVNVISNSSAISVDCIENCYPPFLDGEMMFVASCKFNCPTDVWLWNLYTAPDDDESLINGKEELGNPQSLIGNRSVLTLLQNQTLPNTSYIITCALETSNGTAASYKFKTLMDSDFSCSIVPDKGYILDTTFSFNCVHADFGSYYWVTLVSAEDREQVLQYDSSWEYLFFNIPRMGVVYLRYAHFTGSEGYIDWDPSYGDSFQLLKKEIKSDEIEDLYNEGNQSISSLLESYDYVAVLDKMTVISKSIAEMNISETEKLRPVMDSIVTDMKKIPMNNLLNIQQASGIIGDLTSINTSFDPDFSSKITTFCKDLSKQHLNVVKQEYSDTKSGDLPLKSTISELMACSEVVSRPNQTAVEPKEFQFEITTVNYINEEGMANTETYDDYVNDEEASRNKEKYMDVTTDFIDICNVNGQTLLRRLLVNKDVEKVKTAEYTITAFRKRGYRLNEIAYEEHGVKLMFPRYLRDSYFIFSVVDANHTDKDQLPIHVIILEAGKSLCIEFTDLEDNVTLNVLSTDFEIPTLDHFSNTTTAQVISKNSKYFVDERINDYHGYRLIAVIPNTRNEFNENKTLVYSMKAYAISCVKWDKDERKWIAGCPATFSRESEAIICACEELSTISVTLEEIEIKDWQKYLPLDKNLEERSYYITSIFLGLSFLFYCILICFGVKEVNCTQISVFFLSDVTRRSRFGYLIKVKTGSKLGAGTTANVTIRIIGIKAASEPHVLNYPDPLLKLLQRGKEDWYFLATQSHLGKILEIELWFDGIGSLPSWYCSIVRIFDVQDNIWYDFRVSKLFNMYPKIRIYAKANPSNIYKDESFKATVTALLEKCLSKSRLFNLSLRQTDDSMSYIKRITLMFSILSSIALFCLIIYGVPKQTPIDSITKFCEYRFTGSVALNGIGSSTVAAIYHIPITHIFMAAKVQLPYDKGGQKNKHSLIWTVGCWLFLIIIIIVKMTLLITYGVWIPDITVYMWITSVLIGMLFYIIVIEGIRNFLVIRKIRELNQENAYIKRKLSEIIERIEVQRAVLYKEFGKYLLRPFLQHLYRPLGMVQMKLQWMIEKMKFEVRELIENLVMFILYISLMYMVILANRDSRIVYSNQHVLKLMAGERAFPLERVFSIRTLEDYIEKTLIQVTQSKTWYGTYAVRDPGMTIDYKNKMLGVIRFRQHRSEEYNCEIPEIMNFKNRSWCLRPFFTSESTSDFGVGWSNDEPSNAGRMSYVWKFIEDNVTGTSSILGKLGHYPGSGYVAFLGRGMKNSFANFEYLKHFSWFDELTRVVFIEFLLYNADFNVFNAVRFSIEKSVTGYLKIEVQVETSRMILVKREKIIALTILLVLFSALVAIMSIRTLARIYRTGVWFFRDAWHLVDIILIVLSVGCICLFYHRSNEVGKLLKSLEGIDPKEFINYFALLRVDNTFTIIAAILIGVATLKLWGLFRFMVIFRIVERTFLTCFFALGALVVYHVIIIAAFAVSGYVLFVDHSYKFEGIVNSVEFLLELTMRPFEGEELEMLHEPQLGIGYMFYTMYSIFSQTFTCIYTALIIIYYSKAQEHFSNLPEVYTVRNYLSEQVKFYYNLLKLRLKSLRLPAGHDGEKNDSPLSPKSDEHRFANCLTLSHNKLKTMSLISLCVLRNSDPDRKPLTQKDIRLMTYTLYYMRKIENEAEEEEDVERFFKGSLGGNKVKLIPESQITKAEIATSIMLGRKKEEIWKTLNIYEKEVTRIETKYQLKRINENLSAMLDAVNNIKVKIK